MADKVQPIAARDFADPAQVAIRFTQMEGLFESIQLAHANSSQNLANAIQGLQQSVHEISSKLGAIQQLEHDRQSHSEGLDRAFKAIEALALENKAQWERFLLQEETYRANIAAENKTTRDKLVRWSGVSIAASVFATAIVALVVTLYNTDKSNSSRDLDTLTTEQSEHMKEADERFDKIEGVLIEHCVKQGKPCQFR